MLPEYPSTWSGIHTSSSSIAKAFLECSGRAHLDVHLTNQQQGVLDLTILHSDRFRQLHLFLNTSPTYCTFQRFTAPHLTSLTLLLPNYTDSWNVRWLQARLSSESFPNLTKLHLSATPIPPGAGFTRLTHLCLRDCLPSIAKTLRLLQANPNLQELILSNHRWNYDSTPQQVVELPFLRWIYLEGATRLLKWIRIAPQFALRLFSSEFTTFMVPLSASSISKLKIQGLMHRPGSFTALDDDRYIYHFVSEEAGLFDFALQSLTNEPQILAGVEELWLYDCQLPYRADTSGN